MAGVFNLEDPVENSSTEGAAVGAIIGIYRLDKNKTDVSLYDPTGNVSTWTKLFIQINC